MPVRKPRIPTWLGAIAALLLVAAGIGVLLIARRPGSPPLVASLHDGATLATLNAAGEIGGLSNLDAQERAWIGDALRTGRLPLAPSLDAPRPTVLRGSAPSERFQLLGPVARRVVEDQPEFRWEAVAGASGYEITVFTADEKIVAQGVAASSPWRPSSPLPREVRLGWQVTANRSAGRITAPVPPDPQAFFELIPAASAARIERARGSHLELAVLFASNGLVEEAQAELTALESENPGSPLVKQLRESLLQ